MNTSTKFINHILVLLTLVFIYGCPSGPTPLYTLNADVSPAEAGTVSPATGQFDKGEQLQIIATANEHWVFEGWQGDQIGTQNPLSITMDSDKIITALFEKRDYHLSINIIGEGNVEKQLLKAITSEYPHGTDVELTAIPAEGWEFVQWSGDVESTERVVKVTIQGTTDITVEFKPLFFFHSNGVTIMCPNSFPGDRGTVNGVEYESVDRNLLIQRINEAADLSKVCVSLVTDMSEMFRARNVNQSIENWDVSSVTDMDRMFYDNSFNQFIGIWDVSKVMSMSGMFHLSQFQQPIGNWDVGNVTDMSGMFRYSTFDQPIGDWDVSNVTDMKNMFRASHFRQPIGDWNVSSVTNMSNMFRGDGDDTNHFNKPIGEWDVNNVTDMSGMFQFSLFNQPIGDWDVSGVTDMDRMFFESFNFNQSINLWCVVQITSEPEDFSTDSPLSEEMKPVWGTCPNNQIE